MFYITNASYQNLFSGTHAGHVGLVHYVASARADFYLQISLISLKSSLNTEYFILNDTYTFKVSFCVVNVSGLHSVGKMMAKLSNIK